LQDLLVLRQRDLHGSKVLHSTSVCQRSSRL
jgi:hypothetical protein